MEGAEAFTGRARDYAGARPGYPDAAIAYVRGLAPPDAVFADIGAGTGKFTEPLARYGHTVYAVEPNADMRGQLIITLSPYANARIYAGTAEDTGLPGRCADVVVSAQALPRFDIALYRAECQRIGRPGFILATLYNYERGAEKNGRYDEPVNALYRNPIFREFDNPVFFTRETWRKYFASMSGVPLKSDAGYEAYARDLDERFNRESVNGILRYDLVTKVYSERME